MKLLLVVLCVVAAEATVLFISAPYISKASDGGSAVMVATGNGKSNPATTSADAAVARTGEGQSGRYRRR